MKKTLLQKMAQFLDVLPIGKEKETLKKDYLQLKLSKESKLYLSMQKKYKKIIK